VLQGHDHTYARGHIPTLETVAAGKGLGPVFVNSVSGAKQYPFRENGWDDYEKEGVTLQRLAENTQLIQRIRIDGDRLDFYAYDASGALYDRMTVRKPIGEPKRLEEGPSLGAPRRFENTGPYPGAGNLNLDD
jgi:hypothetical protein